VPAIEIVFTNAGRKRFAEVTKTLAGKQLGVVIDRKLVAAPLIQEPILSGTVTLTGKFTKEAAEALAKKVNAGK
jgi:preprotein translocase subunit SecD